MHTAYHIAAIHNGLQTLAPGRWSRSSSTGGRFGWRRSTTRGKQDTCNNHQTEQVKHLTHDHLLLISEF
jgi:hypothetical protein